MTLEYKIASGYNNAAGLTLIEAITVSGKYLHSSVVSLGTFETGVERTYLDGTIEDTGYASWTWAFATLTPAEYAHIATTYLSGNRSGPVTVRTRLNTGAWANYNAIATLQRNPRMTSGYFEEFEIKFSQGVAL